ncbi:cobalamin biosynthesis protein [Paraburkholderia sp. MPAMCS5]|uniref:cobalamin biosynthesis protein n=1 Tax=Paraburkholderia sp. MPAMCS5 TaxID=3112563 RepID=UPI002E195F88|nr:cobalamin biosynthesis protein [Paraburkholderia sp. MPAMCS5]
MKALCVGIGCRLHTSADDIETAVRAALGSHAFEEIARVACIETKAREPGLLEFCARHALPLEFFSRAQIAATTVAAPSVTVREHIGVEGVCEPCALLAASLPVPDRLCMSTAAHDPAQLHAVATARLIVGKIVRGGVTVAIASATPARADSANLIQQDFP